MLFKQLDIFGFKSFANKTTIRFEPGVTAIVGPNGSGKSNVVDAIRWVLGEHNPRDVRAPRLEDVIFNGTDDRPPLSMAEVTLTIDNTKGLLPISFSEIQVTRRVYRSGESEYLINKSPCRLRDIQELFLGTGLGGGTYAIIEQGHVDLVLSSKPAERRVVFEEASGIAKYLSKKRETIRRLDETEEHLVRIVDITAEVKRQVSALERQANKARRYKEQWEQLKSLELRLAADELKQGSSRDLELDRKVEALNAQRETLEKQKQERMSSLETSNATVSAIQAKVQEIRTRTVEIDSQIQSHDSQLGLKMRWIDELKQQAQQLELEEAQLRGRLQQFDEQIARTETSFKEVEQQLAGIAEVRSKAEAQVIAIEETIQAAVKSIQEAKAQLFEVASEASNSRNKRTEAANRFHALEAHLGRLEGQHGQLAARREYAAKRREIMATDRQALSEQFSMLQGREASTQSNLDTTKLTRDEALNQLHEQREQLAAERANVKLQQDLWQKFEGFPEAVKTLMGEPIDGVIGPLVDLLQATPGNERVVEAALGPLAEALVVRNRQALMHCRKLLSAQQLESCRFIVLDDCPVAVAQMEPTAFQGIGGPVKQLIRTDASYQPLVDWLFNDSWVIDDIDRLLEENSTPQRRLISRQGDRWDRRSWRFNASKENGQSRFGRKRRWEQACEREQALSSVVKELEVALAQAELSWSSAMAQSQSDKGEMVHLTPTLNKQVSLAEDLEREFNQIEEELKAIELETRELSTQKEEVATSLKTTEQEASEAEAAQQAIERALATAQAAREAGESRKQETLVANAQVAASFQSLTDRLQGLTTRQQELVGDRDHMNQQIGSRQSQRTEGIQRSEDLTKQLDGHRQESEKLAQDRVIFRQEQERVAQSLSEEEAVRDQVVPQVLLAEQQLSGLMQKVQEQERQRSERTFRRSHIVERLRELYRIDGPTLEAETRADTPPIEDAVRSLMQEESQKLRTKLEGMGPVSLGSVEEYDALKQRHEFMEVQQQDLIKARDDLKTSIAQINRTARVQFRETFAKIREEFKHYFTRLFDGGKADLILEDEEDVLESGIDIVAQPPGKRLQSISLLSGGERALIAIALLFALFKVRPSPFCILDEIDAPLDEANVDRFTRVFEEFLNLSQFILITHNKKTISKADSLYGVTMEEVGVSKILSAKLSQGRPAE